MKIYDAFLFFNELDLLEIRLNVLDKVVDYFVISECNVTFSGKPKPYYYLENKDRFKQFEHKIIHQMVTDTPSDYLNLQKIPNPNPDQACVNKIFDWIETATNFPREQAHWGRDNYQRECLHRALLNCADTDIICFSDIDEIPDPATFARVLQQFPTDQIFTLCQKEFNYYLNMFKQDGWKGPRIANYGVLKHLALNSIRAILPEGGALVNTVEVAQGGWHFTSLGGTEKIIEKIESWGHQELNTPKIKKAVKKNVESGKDIFLRHEGKPLIRIDITDKDFPLWLVQNQEKYQHLINHDFVNGSQRESFGEKVWNLLRRIKRWIWNIKK